MGRHRGWKLLAVCGIMLLIFTGYTSETALVSGDESLALAIGDKAGAKPPDTVAAPAKTAAAPSVSHTDISADRKTPGGAGNESAAAAEAAVQRERTVDESAGQPAKPPVKVKRVALTFDDGPDPKYTPLILDELKKCDVKATFFVVGVQVSRNGEMLKRIVKEGHAVGNHSWDHAKLTKRTAEQVRDEIVKTDEAIRKTLGTTTDLFRPPYGAADDNVKKIVEAERRRLIGWTVDTRDWAGTPPSEMLENVKKHTKPEGIILMHCFGGKDGKLDNTVELLPQLIDYLKQQGYTFVTVPELVGGQRS
ncbi:polysaccharide deacetylase family protein [Paenibacillus sp. GYB003]|uniref:polysaccharide deacetylase family protein n=1 Tax=Paenibacillus sp. GYB003 TaxID=2994392 RepID=UPI002F964780